MPSPITGVSSPFPRTNPSRQRPGVNVPASRYLRIALRIPIKPIAVSTVGLVLVLTAAQPAPAVAADGSVAPVPAHQAAATDDGAKGKSDPRPNPAASADLELLRPLVGQWEFTATHFDAAGEIAGKQKGTEDITWILDQSAIQRTYVCPLDKGAFRAIGLLTFHESTKQFEGIWIDNQSRSGPSTIRGKWDADARAWISIMESAAPSGAVVRYKVVEQLINDERRTTTTYRMEKDQVAKVLEVRYRRIVCPPAVHQIGTP